MVGRNFCNSTGFRYDPNNAQEVKSKILAKIKDYEYRLSNGRDLLSSLQIDASDYRSMKVDYTDKISKLEHELSEISNDRQSIDGLLNCGIDNLIKLNVNYNNASLAEARDLIGLIYPENFTIRGNQVQTTRINKVIESIYMINSELCRKKNGTKESFFSLSRKVTLTGFKPVTS